MSRKPFVNHRRPRVLMVAEAVTLAHLARPLALSRALERGRYDVHLACDPRYNAFLAGSELPFTPLHSISRQRFLEALAKGRPVYDADTLAAQVEEDIGIIDTLNPDVIVGDFRLSLGISARLAGKPYITITNAYWSPYAQRRFPIPELPWVRWVGVPIAQAAFNLVRPLAFRLHAAPMNRVRRRYGLRSLAADLETFYTEADYTLYADVPSLFPLSGMPAAHRYIGAVLWEPPVALPRWWDALPAGRPLVFVSLGSSGDPGLLPQILEAVADLPMTVMVAGAGRAVPAQLPDNARVADYLPGVEAARRSCLVICNGGSPASQQALVAGVPVLGLCSNMDQFMNMEAIEQAGAGRLLRAGKADKHSIQVAAQALLNESGYRRAAQGLRDAYGQYDALERFRATVDEALGG